LAKEQAELEKSDLYQNSTKEERAFLEKDRLQRLRFLITNSRRLSKKASSSSINSSDDNDTKESKQVEEEEKVVVLDTKERLMKDIKSKLEREHVNTKVSSLYTGHHKVTSNSDENDLDQIVKSDEEKPSDDVDTSTSSSGSSSSASSNDLSSSAKSNNSWELDRVAAQRNVPARTLSLIAPVIEQEGAVVSNENEENDFIADNEQFILSPKHLPKGMRRSELHYETLESIVDDKGFDDDDARSLWTEYIINDKDERDNYYKQSDNVSVFDISNKSYYDEVTVNDDDDETLYEEYTVVTANEEEESQLNVDRLRNDMMNHKKNSNKPNVYNFDDAESYMEMTVFDDGRSKQNNSHNDYTDNDTVQVSYLEDDSQYVPVGSGPSIYAHSNDDDNMTQITMETALCIKSKNGNHPLTASSTSSGSISSTSKKQIQKILWNNLYSCDVPTVEEALDGLKSLLIHEAENSAKQIVRLGGVMAILGTMEEYSEVENIQYLSLVVLEILSSLEPEARTTITDMDGIQLIARSMTDHKNSSDDQRIKNIARSCLATICS